MNSRWVGTGVVWVCVMSNAALGGTIDSMQAGALNGNVVDLTSPIDTFDPNNDNITGPFSDNFIQYDVSFLNFQWVDVRFNVNNSSGVSEYEYFIAVTNNTGAKANGLTLTTGYNLFGQFVHSDASDGVDFDAPTFDPQPSSSGIGIGLVPQGQADYLSYRGGIWLTTNRLFFSFFIDVPDDASIPESAKTEGGYIFTIRHTLVPLGDTDADDDVDANDLDNVKAWFDGPAPNSPGDADGDGDTDIDDLVAVKNTFGFNVPPPGPSFVPEPASVTLLIFTGLAIFRLSRRH